MCRGGQAADWRLGGDHVFECVGSTALIEHSLGCVDWGGNVVVLGVPEAGQTVEFLPAAMYLDVSIMGCRYGTARPFADVQRITDFYRAGKLRLDELVSRVYALDEIHALLEDMRRGGLASGGLEVGAF